MIFTSKTLAKHIVDNFIRRLPDDNVESVLTTMLENFKNSEINKYITNVNTENMAKMKQKEIVVKTPNEKIERNRAWPRSI